MIPNFLRFRARQTSSESDSSYDPSVEAFIRSVEFKVNCGYRLMWKCYGLDACALGWSPRGGEASASVVYDCLTHAVYEMKVCDYAARLSLRWIRPTSRDAHDREAIRMGFKPKVDYDDVEFRDSSPSECFLLLRRLFKRHERKIRRGGDS